MRRTYNFGNKHKKLEFCFTTHCLISSFMVVKNILLRHHVHVFGHSLILEKSPSVIMVVILDAYHISINVQLFLELSYDVCNKIVIFKSSGEYLDDFYFCYHLQICYIETRGQNIKFTWTWPLQKILGICCPNETSSKTEENYCTSIKQRCQVIMRFFTIPKSELKLKRIKSSFFIKHLYKHLTA